MSHLRSLLAVLLLGFCVGATAQTITAFHYAGTLTDAQMAAATGNYDIRVRLYDGPTSGAQQLGTDVLLSPVPVTLGFFAIDIDFGMAILAPQSWLEFAVQPTGVSGFQTLSPRQQIGHVPFALYAEGADWSGLANVPPGVAALSNAVPPAIGNIATNPLLAGTAVSGANQLVLRQVQFTVSRPVTTTPPITLGQVSAQDVELWLEPTLALPSIATAVDAGTVFTGVTLNLNFVGAAPNTIAKFTNVVFDSAMLEPAADASGTTLAHVKFHYLSVLVGGSTFNYSYNLGTATGTAIPPACPAFLSTLGYGAVPADFPSSGFVTLSRPSVFNVTKPALPPGSSPKFSLPELSVALTAATATASTSLVVCALALATSNQRVLPAPTWSQYSTGAADATSWSTQLAWDGVYLSGFGLNSDSSGNVSLSWEFAPTTTNRITTQNPAKTSTYTSCWNVTTNAGC